MSLTSCSCTPPTLARISSSWEEGYGHSHLPAFVVGGVTQSPLRSMTEPVLMLN